MYRRPPVLIDIDKLRKDIELQVWKANRMRNQRVRDRRLRELEENQTRLERVEQFIRRHMPEEELKGILE